MGDTNEQVAKACGFEGILNATGTVYIRIDGACRTFSPATRPEDALSALEAYGELCKMDVRYERIYCAGSPTRRCLMTPFNREEPTVCEMGDDPCTAICAAIVAAEGKRNG